MANLVTSLNNLAAKAGAFVEYYQLETPAVEVFRAIDVDGSGLISQEELFAFLAAMKAADTNGECGADQHPFFHNESTWPQLFQLVDKDSSGTISIEECKTLFYLFCQRVCCRCSRLLTSQLFYTCNSCTDCTRQGGSYNVCDDCKEYYASHGDHMLHPYDRAQDEEKFKQVGIELLRFAESYKQQTTARRTPVLKLQPKSTVVTNLIHLRQKSRLFVDVHNLIEPASYLFRAIDVNGKGAISRDEFYAFLTVWREHDDTAGTQPAALTNESIWPDLFNLVDQDSNGGIDFDEFKLFCYLMFQRNCNLCRRIFTSDFFDTCNSCETCKHNSTSYDVCIDCKSKHDHAEHKLSPYSRSQDKVVASETLRELVTFYAELWKKTCQQKKTECQTSSCSKATEEQEQDKQDVGSGKIETTREQEQAVSTCNSKPTTLPAYGDFSPNNLWKTSKKNSDDDLLEYDIGNEFVKEANLGCSIQ